MFQASDSNNITIEDDINLSKLVSLEIHGNNNPTRVYITNKMFKSIKNIKYLNIQSVSLEKLSLESNEPVPIIDTQVYKKENSYEFNELIPILPMHLHKEKTNTVKNKLIFLKPKDIDMIPYEIYKKTKRGAKSNSLFINNKNLLFLRITYCGLKDISWDIFEGLDSLETLILDNNAIEYIPDFSFYGARILKSLSLANNKIKLLQTTGLAGLLDLQSLNLKNNALTILSETTFPPLPKLKVVDLSNNPIEMVYPYTFEVLNATKKLSLGANDIQLNLRTNSFVGLDSLEILNLISVNVTVLERTLLTGLEKLIELNIKGIIRHIAFDAFVEIPNIKRLILSNCSIQSVSMDSFYGIYNLEHLDLSHNQLQELPPGLFDQQFSLRELILNNNLLTSLPDGIFKTIPNAKLIRLDINPLQCNCQMKSWDVSLMTKSTKNLNKYSCGWDNLKEYSCSIKSTTIYTYNKKAEPICSSPTKFKGMPVSYVLRKYLNCETYNAKNNLYLKKKYKEYKHYELLNEHKVKQNTSVNTSFIINPQLNTSFLTTNTYGNISTETASIIFNTNVTSSITTGSFNAFNHSFKASELITNKLLQSTTEKNILLINGSYISKSSLKEEISKGKRKYKDSKLQTKLKYQ